MRILLLAGASALALSAPLHAEQAPAPAQPNEQPSADEAAPAPAPGGSPLDTLVTDDSPAAAPTAAAATGNPVLDRLNALEARIHQLEARNQQLEQQAEVSDERLKSVEVRSTKAVQFGWVPTIGEPTGAFTFKPRGVVDIDAAAFRQRRGGYDFNNGTAFRRARIGFEGTAFNAFNYRVEADFAGNVVSITDAYLQYTRIPKILLTLGQHKAPFGLESNNSDNYNVFMERGMFTNAFGNAGAERRIGLSATWSPREAVSVSAGVFGDNESVARSTGTPVTNTPSESRGVNARATWEPVFDRQDRPPRPRRLLPHQPQDR